MLLSKKTKKHKITYFTSIKKQNKQNKYYFFVTWSRMYIKYIKETNLQSKSNAVSLRSIPICNFSVKQEQNCQEIYIYTNFQLLVLNLFPKLK